jgi:integrase
VAPTVRQHRRGRHNQQNQSEELIMAKSNLLTATFCRNIKEPGLYADGNGLFLNVSKSGSKSWLLRYRWQGKRPEIGLGSYIDIPLAEARDKMGDCRKLIRKGIDPRQRDKATGDATVPTFKDCAAQFIKAKRSEWSNLKHQAQWEATLKTYADPTIGPLPVDQIDLEHILAILTPIWESKTETATRVRGRIERVLSWAIVKGYRRPPNPALWRGNLDMVLPQPTKVKKATHYAALPYADLPALWNQITASDSVSSKALQLAILTTARTIEIIGAQWSEIDLDAKVWTVPSKRMKAKREHRVPLTQTALDLLETIPHIDNSPFLFPGQRGNPHISNMAMLYFLKRDLQRPDLTVHGFRSTFKDWAAETTTFPGELSEAQLAHAIANKAQAAYERGDKLERRRELLTAWEAYLLGIANVVALRRAG